MAINTKKVMLKYSILGKLEIPGIQSSDYLYTVLDALVEILQPHCEETLEWEEG